MFEAAYIANEFIRRSLEQNTPLTHMHIQKLVYFAHARMLSLHRKPLISEEFEAWKYGPVVPELYDALKINGWKRIRKAIPLDSQPEIARRERDIINWSFSRYGHLGGPKLSELTHAPEAPWDKAKRQDSSVIRNEDIEQYYLEEWREETEATLKQLRSDPEIQAAVKEGIEQFERGEYYTVSNIEELQDLIASHAEAT